MAPLCGKYELFAAFILTDSEGVKSWIATTIFLLVVKPLSAWVCLSTIFSSVWSVVWSVVGSRAGRVFSLSCLETWLGSDWWGSGRLTDCLCWPHGGAAWPSLARDSQIQSRPSQAPPPGQLQLQPAQTQPVHRPRAWGRRGRGGGGGGSFCLEQEYVSRLGPHSQ